MNSEQIVQLIARHAGQVIPSLANHAFSRGDRLRDLGANSMDRAEIVTLVLESLALSIPRVELFGPSNIGELADLIQARLEARAR